MFSPVTPDRFMRAAVCGALLCLHAPASPAVDPRWMQPDPSWSDSYSLDGVCYCESSFDHGAGELLVQTPAGMRTARQVCDAIGEGPGSSGLPIYNDLQCGHGPGNDLGDEQACPGRVDLGPDGCDVLGPTWPLDELFPAPTAPAAPEPPPPQVIAPVDPPPLPVAGVPDFPSTTVVAMSYATDLEGPWQRAADALVLPAGTATGSGGFGPEQVLPVADFAFGMEHEGHYLVELLIRALGAPAGPVVRLAVDGRPGATPAMLGDVSGEPSWVPVPASDDELSFEITSRGVVELSVIGLVDGVALEAIRLSGPFADKSSPTAAPETDDVAAPVDAPSVHVPVDVDAAVPTDAEPPVSPDLGAAGTVRVGGDLGLGSTGFGPIVLALALLLARVAGTRRATIRHDARRRR